MSTRTERVLPKASAEALSHNSHKLLASIALAGLHPTDEMKILDELILIAKARRNVIVPIARMLPVEVLGEIFEHAITDPKDRPRGPYNPWAAIMLVCRSWRNIAVNHPALWTTLANRNTIAWPTFIARSRNLPIDVALCTNASFVGDALDVALDQLHRIRSFELRAPQPLLETVLARLNQPAPKLTRLVLENRSHGWCHALKGSFVSEHAQNLRSLFLTGVSFPWGIRAQNLRVLFVSGEEHMLEHLLDPTFSVPNALHSLSSPSLEEICVNKMHLLPAQSLAVHAVQLSELKVLKFRDTAPEIALPLWFSTSSILDSLAETDVMITTLPATFTPANMDQIVTHAAAHMANHPAEVRTLKFGTDWSFRIESDMFKFYMPMPSFNIPSADILMTLLAATSPEHLTSLELELKNGVELPEATLGDVLTRIPRIRDLKLAVRPSTMHLFARMLRRHITNPENAPLLPWLRQLCLFGMNLNQQYQDRPLHTYITTMLNCRRLRTPNLGPFTMYLAQCTITSAAITGFSVAGSITVNCDDRTHDDFQTMGLGPFALGAEPWAMGVEPWGLGGGVEFENGNDAVQWAQPIMPPPAWDMPIA